MLVISVDYFVLPISLYAANIFTDCFLYRLNNLPTRVDCSRVGSRVGGANEKCTNECEINLCESY